MKTIKDLDAAAAILSSWVEVQEDSGGLGSTKRNQLSDILALAGAGDLDAVLVAGNDAAGIGITELASIDNLTNDFDLLVDNGNVIFNFGNAPSGIFGLDASADEMQFLTSNFINIGNSDLTIYGTIDNVNGIIEFGNGSSYLRITDFDIEVGAPILGYSTTSEMQSYVNGQLDSQNRVKFVKGRTTAALPACTANAGFTTLTCNSNQAFSGLTTETDGLTYGLLQDILVMNESDHKRWGIYQLSQPGSNGGGGSPWVLTRRADANPGTDLTNMIVLIEQGTRFKNTSWRQTTLNPVFGTDNLAFVPFADGIREDSSGGYWRIDVSTLGVLTTTSI